MRMVGTQAKTTKAYLNKARDIILKAIKTNNFKDLQFKLQKELNLMPAQAMVLVNELAQYEAQFTYKKIVKNTTSDLKRDVVKLTEDQVSQVVNETLINTSIDAPKRTVENAYKQFAAAKTMQYMQIVQDAQLEDWDDEEIEQEVNERTNGLFTTQNVALAGLALLSVVSSVRAETADENGMQVEWVLDLELNNCSYCEDMAAGGPYDLMDVSDEVPAHSNCGCALVPILGDMDE